VGEGLSERYRRQAALAPASFLLTALQLANDCDINFKMARHKRLHVEMALLKMCYINRAIAAAGSTEKKTPEPSIAESKPAQAAPSATAPAPANPRNESKPATIHSNAAELSQSAMSELKTELRLGLKRADKVSLRLEDFEEAVAVEEAEKAAQESRLTIENAQTEWRTFADSCPSPTLRQAMTEAELHLEDQTLVVQVGLSMHRGLIQEEMSRLLDTLRARLHDPGFKIRIKVDKAKAAQMQEAAQSQKPLTVKEKLDKMREMNPLVNDLLERFDLKLDE
jgi:DNA polymerase-3 subunit gamma/tau